MSTLSLIKAALYSLVILVMQRVAFSISKNENEIYSLGISSSASDLLLIERLGRDIERSHKQLSTLRSLVGDN